MTVCPLFPPAPPTKVFEPKAISSERLYEKYQHAEERYNTQQTHLRREVMKRAYNDFLAVSKSEGR